MSPSNTMVLRAHWVGNFSTRILESLDVKTLLFEFELNTFCVMGEEIGIN